MGYLLNKIINNDYDCSDNLFRVKYPQCVQLTMRKFDAIFGVE